MNEALNRCVQRIPQLYNRAAKFSYDQCMFFDVTIVSKSPLNAATDFSDPHVADLREYSNGDERVRSVFSECTACACHHIPLISIHRAAIRQPERARGVCNGCAPCERGLIRPRARPCTVSAAAPFTRGAGLHLTSHEYSTRARTLTPPPAVAGSLKQRTQKTAWSCGAHRASQDNEATPRGRPADRSATCSRRGYGERERGRARARGGGESRARLG